MTRSGKGSLGIVLAVAMFGTGGCGPSVRDPKRDDGSRIETGVATDRPAQAASRSDRQSLTDLPRKTYASLFVGEIHFQRRYFVRKYNVDSLAETRSAWMGISQNAIDAVRQRVRETESNPKEHISALWLLAKLLVSYGQIEAAIQEYSRCLELTSHDPTLALPEMRDRMLASLAVAHLRFGETRTCIDYPNPENCVFPLRVGGRHRDPGGATQAAQLFETYLAEHPEDFEIRWLLNISYMALGGYPDDVPPRYLIPPDVFESPIDVGPFPNVARALGVDSFDSAGGAIIDDFNNDGYLDIFTSTMEHLNHARHFRNNGDGTFEDVSNEAGLAQQTGGLNAVHADYDNDGDYDVYILRGGWYYPEPNSLLRNRGDGRFEDVTEQAGLLVQTAATQTACWADLDNDGDLDLYVGAESRRERPARNQLFINRGDGTFSEEAEPRGVTNDRFCKGVTAGDFDNDGDSDIYVSNFGAANRLYLNDGAGRFQDVARYAGLEDSAETFATWFWDFDNDGWLDIFVAGYHVDMEDSVRSYLGLSHRGTPIRLYRNLQGKRFVDLAQQAGLTRAYLPMGANFGDIDNDGFLDFMLGTGEPSLHNLMPNVVLKSVGGERFVDVTTSGRFGSLHKGHGIAFGDLDNDGDQDIYAQLGGMMGGDRFYNALYENPGHGHHWIALDLVGRTSNRNAIGARVNISVVNESGQRRQIHRVISSGGSFGGNTFRMEAGLGDARRIETIEVWWPTSNTRQRFSEVPLDRMFRIEEGHGELIAQEKTAFRLATGVPDHQP
jgi:hypothetical protein